MPFPIGSPVSVCALLGVSHACVYVCYFRDFDAFQEVFSQSVVTSLHVKVVGIVSLYIFILWLIAARGYVLLISFCDSKRGRKRSFELDFGPCQHAYVRRTAVYK